MINKKNIKNKKNKHSVVLLLLLLGAIVLGGGIIFANKNKQITSLNNEIKSITYQYEESEANFLLSSRKLVEKQAIIDSLTLQIVNKDEMIASYELELASKTTELVYVNAEVLRLESIAEGLYQSLMQSQTSNDELQSQLADVNTQLSQAIFVRDSLQSQVNTLTAENTRLEEQAYKMLGLNSKVCLDLEAAQEELAQLENQYNAILSEKETLQALVTQLQSRIAELELQLGDGEETPLPSDEFDYSRFISIEGDASHVHATLLKNFVIPGLEGFIAPEVLKIEADEGYSLGGTFERMFSEELVEFSGTVLYVSLYNFSDFIGFSDFEPLPGSNVFLCIVDVSIPPVVTEFGASIRVTRVTNDVINDVINTDGGVFIDPPDLFEP